MWLQAANLKSSDFFYGPELAGVISVERSAVLNEIHDQWWGWFLGLGLVTRVRARARARI